MKTKLEKTLKTAAAIIFVAALGLNIIATLDGSAIYSDAIAQETGTEDSETGEWRLRKVYAIYYKRTFLAYPPFYKIEETPGHKAVCSNDGTNMESCIDYVHAVRMGSSCFSCDEYLGCDCGDGTT